MKILVVEDDTTSRSILSALLGKAGYEVLEAVNGAEAWHMLQQPDSPRIAIVDWMMPEMDGIELIRRLRAAETMNPRYIIMVTTRDEKEHIVEALDAGADDYLTKPFNHGELRARIEAGRRIVEMQAVLGEKIEQLHQALEQIKTLRGILPICSSCKKIRDDQGYWSQVETYIRNHTDAQFSHSICPQCIGTLYPSYGGGERADKKKDEDGHS